MEITTTTTTYKLTQEESAVLLCELAHENNTHDIATFKSNESKINDLVRDNHEYMIRRKIGSGKP